MVDISNTRGTTKFSFKIVLGRLIQNVEKMGYINEIIHPKNGKI